MPGGKTRWGGLKGKSMAVKNLQPPSQPSAYCVHVHQELESRGILSSVSCPFRAGDRSIVLICDFSCAPLFPGSGGLILDSMNPSLFLLTKVN